MILSTPPQFGRLITAMVTPFDDDLQIDFAAVERIVNHLIDTGTETILVGGTTGESPTLEETEKKYLLGRVIATAKGRAKVIMGTGSNSTAKTIKSSQEAKTLGADGLLTVVPYYNKPSQDGLLAHFEAVAMSTTLPIILYNIPGRTGTNMSADTTVELSKNCKNIFGLKDSTGSIEQASDIAASARESFRIYSGDDYLTLPFLSIGACGVISVASHIAGLEIVNMMDAFFEGNLEQARKLHYEHMSLFKGLFLAPNPTCVKFALSLLGLCKPHVRLPLVSPGETQRRQVAEVMTGLGIKIKQAV
jgi:4-hydroxy-tetrahydrodipicolinate synthase